MKVVFWLLVAIGIVYALYSGAVAVRQYMEVMDVVEESVQLRMRLDKYERPGRVKDDILRKAPAAGLTLDEREVVVTEEDRTLRVLIRWSYPVVIYKGEAVLSIPIAYDRSFRLAP